MGIAAAIIGGAVAVIGAGISAGAASSAADDDEEARRKKAQLAARRKEDLMRQSQRAVNRGAMERLEGARDVAKASLGAPTQKSATRGSAPTVGSAGQQRGSDNIDPYGGSESSDFDWGSVISGGSALAGSVISAAGASAGASSEAALQAQLGTMEEKQFQADLALKKREEDLGGLDMLARQRMKAKQRSSTHNFNRDLSKAFKQMRWGGRPPSGIGTTTLGGV